MGQVHLGVGTRYERDGRTFLGRLVLGDGRLVVEDQSGGGQGVVTREGLTAAWADGALRFAGRGARTEEAGGRPRAYTIADFHVLPAGERAEAWRRYALIQPLLAWPPGRRTRRAIAEYLSSAAGPEHTTHGAAGEATSRGSVERYLRAYEASGGDIRSLVPTTIRRDTGRSGLEAELEEVIQGVLVECRAAPAQRTARAVYFMMIERVRVRNQGRAPAEQIGLPGLSTIERRVKAAGRPGRLLRVGKPYCH